ncbi:nuclear cap-binding protein subunit 2 [Vairimorpha apis BRL 01]|uniref:Nuclear cap-binding protein subunit 2 n=1 Tax=Vairimorpha apis BRL 01 TaxID=1037528 RepID=T0KW37_9MICR|nr:nuclear cap-binding protein subunit 2 [Vairimorpha apis BRL 01]
MTNIRSVSNELGLIHGCKTKIIPYVLTCDDRIEAYIQSVTLKKTLESVSMETRGTKTYILNRTSYYKEKTFTGTDEEYLKLMEESNTIYINNLDNSIDESRIWELGLLFGDVKRVIMGINRNFLTFCGFCFIEYYNKEDANKCKIWCDKLVFERKSLNNMEEVFLEEK